MQEKFMYLAAEQAESSVLSGEGGPFGAVIVQNDQVIAAAHNMVIAVNDPTAHAEIVAIRKAAKILGRFDLSDCEIYSSCEPCPMCLAAIHWARISKLYYGCTAQDAAEIGFDDKYIYDAIRQTTQDIRVQSRQILRDLCLKSFVLWREKEDKVTY